MSTLQPVQLQTRKPLSPRMLALTIATGALALVFLMPFYFVLANSVKTYGEILRNAAAFPEGLVLQNYVVAFRTTNFVQAFVNSVVITTLSLIFMVMIGAMAAWRMVRRPHPFSKIVFGMFVVAMVVPFQSVMIPMMKVTSTLNLLNSRLGLVIIYLGFGMPFTVFLLHGFAKTVPVEVELRRRFRGVGRAARRTPTALRTPRRSPTARSSLHDSASSW